jgi:Zn-dependent metalloprotease
MHRSSRLTALVVFVVALVPASAFAQAPGQTQVRDPAGLQRLQADTGGTARVGVSPATKAARSIRVPAGRALGQGAAATLADKQAQSQAFFRDYAALLGMPPGAMRYVSSSTDRLGETHLTWRQYYGSVPVFGALVKTHFDRAQQLKGYTGTAVPDINLNASPSIGVRQAAATALSAVTTDNPGAATPPRVGRTSLYVFRSGLAQSVPGENHLAWEVEITNAADVRELVYVDAHSGKIVNRTPGIHDDLSRRAYDGHNLAFVPQNYPNGAYWLEGQRFPTGSIEANNMIIASKEVYDLFQNAFGRDSFDGAGAKMDAIFNRGYSCPNASWNGTFISFCPGFTTDDVTAHEWGHAYTQYTHDLIYEWQPGALNESYSDIWGEVVDFINNRGTDDPGSRTAGACSVNSPPVARLRVNAPANIANTYLAQSAQFGPALTPTGVTGSVVAALDAADAAGPSTTDACSALTNAAQVSGNIALLQRGTCTFVVKVLNAQAAGAIGVIVDNNVSSGLPGMGGTDPNVTIPSIGIGQADGAAIRSALTSGAVNATLLAQPGTDVSYRWLMGEDITPGGAIRDMWSPNCYSNPAKVTDTAYYVCSTADGGGVHTNSGVPNHAFALLVDGGSYNGQTISSIGLTKAAHIYYRAQSVYQTPTSDFVDHADALESSCTDLVGQALNALTGGPSGEVITGGDCSQVTAAIAAVELRSAAPCAFAPLLAQNTPAQCSATTTSGIATSLFTEDFEAGAAGWVTSNVPTGATFGNRNWTRVSSLPDGRAGFALFADDPNTACGGGNEDSGVVQLTSPPITLTGASFTRAAFDHWVATELGFDGGNLKISVDGGPWQLIPPSAYSFNGYNVLLFTAAQGNTNPLAGQASWSGTDPGSPVGGTWGTTHVNLGGFAQPGQSIRLRWDFGTDQCAGRVGWFVDNLDVFSCVPNTPAITIGDVSVSEGNTLGGQLVFTVRLSQRTIRPVSVQYSIADGTAKHGNDFLPVPDGVVVVPAGALTATIGITLNGDVVPEPDEVMFVNLSNPVGATIADGQAQGTILNDDTHP